MEEDKVGGRVSIYRLESGLIFDDKFELIDSRWELSPPSYFSQSEQGLVISHSENDTMMLFDIPNYDTLLFEVTSDYTPEETCDEGGIVIWKDASYKLEFLETKGDTTENFSL